MQKWERFDVFLRELAAAPPAFSRESALNLVKQIMNKVEDEYSNLPWSNFASRMHVYGFEPEFNWKDLDKDPCHWTDAQAKKHRIALYHNGRIQIFSLLQDSDTTILDKNGIESSRGMRI